MEVEVLSLHFYSAGEDVQELQYIVKVGTAKLAHEP